MPSLKTTAGSSPAISAAAGCRRTTSDKPVRPNLILGICCLSLFLVGMDATIVNVALPSIQRDLHASLAGLQWIVDAYTLVVASLLMLAGSMSDRFGRLRTFQAGLVVFLAGSLLCSIAHSIGALILYRAIQGLGASMLNPVALSIIANVFKAPADRARAVGVWGAVGGIAIGLGPLLGGILTQTIGWRAIFWVNLPMGILALVLAALFVPESKAPRARPVDPVGQMLIFAGLASLTCAVIEGPHSGWSSPRIVSLFLVSAAAWAGFILYEPRRKDPLLDLRFFRSVPFSSATLMAISSFASFAALLFLNALYLQQVQGLSPFKTGLCTLPLAVMITVCAPFSGRLVARFGPRPSLVISGVSILVSALLLTRLSVGTPLFMLTLSYGLFGMGIGMVNPAITNSAVAGMPLDQAGVAAAIASTGRQVGAALGVAIAGTIVAANRGSGPRFAQATHPIWWAIAACGSLIFLLGLLSNTAWARNSTSQVAELLKGSPS